MCSRCFVGAAAAFQRPVEALLCIRGAGAWWRRREGERSLRKRREKKRGADVISSR